MDKSDKTARNNFTRQLLFFSGLAVVVCGATYYFMTAEVWFSRAAYVRIERQVSEVIALPDSTGKSEFLTTVKEALADDKITSFEVKDMDGAYKEAMQLKIQSDARLLERNKKENIAQMLAAAE